MAKNIIKLLDLHDLKKKIITYVVDEGANLNAIIINVNSKMNCEVRGMEESFQSTCFGHAFFKAC
jgi:hypothetical protein